MNPRPLNPLTPSLLNPSDIPDWNQQIAKLQGATIFHTANWARVLMDAYPYRPMYCAAIEDHHITGCIPVMEINSCLTGKRGVGLPFTDMCQPLDKNPKILSPLYQHLIQAAKERKWRYLEIRGGGTQALDTAPSRTYWVHALDLTQDTPVLYKNFKSSNRRNIQKAMLHPIEIQHHTSRQAVSWFYQLNCITRKDHGLPPQPLKFFKALHRHILTTGKGFVSLAYYEGRPIAGAVFLYFKDQVIYKYGASEKAYQHLRPNNLIMWDAIQWAKERGFTQFHLGRTSLDHHGLRRFKQSWYPVESTINYFTRTFIPRRFKTPALNPGYPLLARMPMPLLNLAGRLLYHHIG